MKGPLKWVYDQPAGGERLISEPIGVDHVLVNGQFIRRAGVSFTNTGVGKVLKS